MPDLTLDYRLPVTTVTIGGTRTTVDNPVLDPRVATTRSSHVVTEIVADARAVRTLVAPDPQHNKRTLTVGLASDGRLTSINSVTEDHSDERLKAAVAVGFQTAGMLSPLLATGPPGIAAATLGALAAGAITYGVKALRIDASFPGPAATSRPPATELGIHSRYVAEHPADAEVLASLRWSQMLLVAHAAQLTSPTSVQAPAVLAADLKANTKALLQVRETLAEVEKAYAAWVVDQAVVTHTDHFNETFVIEDLPTTKQLHVAAAAKFPFNGIPDHPSSRRWSPLFEDLRIAVTCDFLAAEAPTDPPTPATTEPSDPTRPRVAFRRQELVTLTTWTVTRDTAGGPYALAPTSVERKIVVRSDREDEFLPLLANKDEGSLAITFDDDGLVASVTSDRTDPKVKQNQALATLPAAAKDAYEAGAALSQPFTSGARVTEKENRAKLKPASADPLQDLRDDLERAELEARLARARTVISDPTRGVFLLTVTENPPS